MKKFLFAILILIFSCAKNDEQPNVFFPTQPSNPTPSPTPTPTPIDTVVAHKYACISVAITVSGFTSGYYATQNKLICQGYYDKENIQTSFSYQRDNNGTSGQSLISGCRTDGSNNFHISCRMIWNINTTTTQEKYFIYSAKALPGETMTKIINLDFINHASTMQ